MRSIPVRHEGHALADMGRQYSAVSKAALKRLENHFGDLQARVDDVEKKVSAGTLDDLLESKNELAQINGLLEKFQFNQLDAVTTAELKSGKENAKIMRKQLNQAVEELQRYTTALHKRISEQVEELKAQQQPQQQQPQQQEPQTKMTQKGEETDEGSQHDNKPHPERNKHVEEERAPHPETQQRELSHEQPQQEQGESVQPREAAAQEAQEPHAESQVALETSPPPQPPAPATTAVPAGTSIPVRRPQAQTAQRQADLYRVPVHVGRSNQSRPSRPPVQQGLTRQQAAAMLQVIGVGYQYGMIDAHTRAVLKDRVLRQDPRLVNVWPTGDVYRDLTVMVRALQ